MFAYSYLLSLLLLATPLQPPQPPAMPPGHPQPSAMPAQHPQPPAKPSPQPKASARLPESIDLSVVRALVVQHDGRWMPLDTLARDLVREVTGCTDFRGRDSVAVLLAWNFDPSV
jgi:hypothetical protein